MKNQNREIEREREVEREERDKFERIYPRAFPQVDDETPSFHMIPLYLGLYIYEYHPRIVFIIFLPSISLSPSGWFWEKMFREVE